jgi:Domain of unknown function (DUF4388)
MARDRFGGLGMRLDGSLEDFGLPDVLQLLAQTAKSGTLHLVAVESERRGLIRLGGGAVDGAYSDLRRQALARRLVGAGLVSDEALSGAAEDVRGGSSSLVRALLDRSELASEDVSRIAADQATDAVCELLRWAAGTFSFHVGEDDPDGLALGLRAEELVAEGQRRMEVWPTLTTQIPSPDTVLRLASSPAFDPTCSREEWGLLALVDGIRSVNEIVALLGRSEFAVAGALAALVERGLLTVSAAGSGLADLQRRQAIIADIENGSGSGEASGGPAIAAQPETQDIAETHLDVSAAAEVPLARESSPSPAMSPVNSVSDGAYDRPLTQGSAALDIAPAEVSQTAPALAEPRTSAEGAVRGLDSTVTKSLVLRLIAGVRGL